MSAQPRRDDLDPISPELVLVSSPEDARRAREQLPEGPPTASTTAVPARPAVAPPIRWPEVVEEPAAPPRRRRRGPLVLGLAFLLAFLGGYLVETRWRTHRSSPAAALPTASPTPAARGSTALTRSSPPPRAQGTQGTQATASATRAAAPATNPSATRASSKATVGPPPPPAAFVPARSWSWAPALNAQAYVVTFFRSGHVVFRARARRPRLVLPRTFRFRAGSYRWTVRPVPAAPNGKPIIDGRFVLSRAAAAAANHARG